MREITYTPDTEYWNGIRQHEEIIFQRNVHATSIVHPEVESTQTWTPDSAEFSGYGNVTFDTIAYRALRCNLFIFPIRQAQITLFADDELDERRGLARVYDIKLKPRKEKLEVYPVFSKLDTLGINTVPTELLRRQKLAAKKIGGILPNKADYDFVATEMQRGASNAYTRWAPIHDIEDNN